MVMCIARHHANINRLIHGNENKLGHKAHPSGGAHEQ
jgi:glycerol-3-phosphate acyltransferase PlsY